MDDNYWYRYYLIERPDNAITDWWSDGPHPEKDTSDAVCINTKGDYQFKVEIDGVMSEENPNPTDWNGIPLYKWTGAEVVSRTQEEIDQDIANLPKLGPSELDKMRADIDFLLVMSDLN